mmetsp:Transcript_326/g.1058  ORF Transcript_326/g.1058 Transcript_326/m.1058 type:complete len:276 (+) Transcript_326:208-1035(+)
MDRPGLPRREGPGEQGDRGEARGVPRQEGHQGLRGQAPGGDLAGGVRRCAERAERLPPRLRPDLRAGLQPPGHLRVLLERRLLRRAAGDRIVLPHGGRLVPVSDPEEPGGRGPRRLVRHGVPPRHHPRPRHLVLRHGVHPGHRRPHLLRLQPKQPLAPLQQAGKLRGDDESEVRPLHPLCRCLLRLQGSDPAGGRHPVHAVRDASSGDAGGVERSGGVHLVHDKRAPAGALGAQRVVAPPHRQSDRQERQRRGPGQAPGRHRDARRQAVGASGGG